MIENEQQYSRTSEELIKFEQALDALLDRQTPDLTNLAQRKSLVDSLRSLISELEVQVVEYKALRDGRMKVLKLTSFAELGPALILARRAVGLSHEQLAERANWLEGMLKRYERDEYAFVRLKSVQEVVKALGIGVRIEVTIPRSSATAKRVQKQTELPNTDVAHEEL